MEISRKNYIKIVERLNDLANGAEPVCIALGICRDIDILMTEDDCGMCARNLVRKIAVDWPEFSGDKDCPVPHPERTPLGAFMHVDNLWVGEYGQARKRLCAFLADEIENRYL